MDAAAPHLIRHHFATLLLVGMLTAPVATRAQAVDADTLSADLDSDVPLSSKILPEPTPDETGAAGLALQLDALVASNYMAQGLDSSFEHRVAQSSLTATRGGFCATLWDNFDLVDGGINEVDFACCMVREVAAWDLSVGYQHMSFPHRAEAPAGNELTFGVALDAPLCPALNVHYDFDAGDGYYLSGQLSHELARGFTATAQLFYQRNYFEVSGLSAAAVTLGYCASVGRLTLKPALTYNRGFSNGDFAGEAAVPSRWVMGVGFSTRL